MYNSGCIFAAAGEIYLKGDFLMDNMKGLKRTNYCGETQGIGNEVVVGGYVQKIRDLGNLIFIDLRDRTGIVQLAFDDGS